MGIFDRFRHGKDQSGGSSTALMDRARGMLHGHSGQVDKGVDKAGQMADERTGHRYTDQINTGTGKAKEMLAEQGGQGSSMTAEPGPESETPRPETGGMQSGEAPPPQS